MTRRPECSVLTSGHCSVGVWTRPRTDVTRDYHEAPAGGQHGIFRHNLHILVQCLGRGRNFKDCRWMGFVGPGCWQGRFQSRNLCNECHRVRTDSLYRVCDILSNFLYLKAIQKSHLMVIVKMPVTLTLCIAKIILWLAKLDPGL